MANTKYISVIINNQVADLDDDAIDAIQLTFALEDPENWQGKQAAYALDLSLPATKTNDGIFNQFSNPNIEDMTTDGTFRETMDISVTCNGVIVFKGKMILTEATSTDKPEKYTFNAWANNGDWLIDGQNLTLWDCVPTGSDSVQTFDKAHVFNSWNFNGLGSGGTPSIANMLKYCFTYPVIRYRQPFGGGDTNVNIYNLRPCLFILPLLYRGFQQMGYTINSQFMALPNGKLATDNTVNFFPRLVLPWTFGDFYDITSQITNGLAFKAVGLLPPAADPILTDSVLFWSGHLGDTRMFYDRIDHTGQYLKTHVSTEPVPYISVFNISTVIQPEGYDNFGLFSFDDTTGIMTYKFNPPPEFLPYLTSVNSLNFTLVLYVWMAVDPYCADGGWDVIMEVYGGSTGTTLVFSNSIINGPLHAGDVYPHGGGMHPGDISDATSYMYTNVTPTTFNFTVTGVAVGDILNFRIKAIGDNSHPVYVGVMSAGKLNQNPSGFTTTVPNWQFNPLKEQWQNLTNLNSYQNCYSSLSLTSFQLETGQIVNFQQYDNLRNYKFFDLLRGLVDLFNLEIQTDPVNKVVTIEPMFPVSIPNPLNASDTINFDGYFRNDRILDYSSKMDWTKESKMILFNSCERQIDFNFKQDGSDGGQNIWGARYKGIYLNNTIKPKVNTNLSVENSIISGVPGAARYVLPNRFSKGNKQLQNAFFSATMHYNHQPWANFYGNNGIAPQLVTIFPENINDSSASAVTATFEPKIAFYHGQTTDGSTPWGYFPWDDLDGSAIETVPLPMLYSVYYGGIFSSNNPTPALTYCDQVLKNSTTSFIKQGLVRLFHLQRLATMRNGQLFEPFLRLNLTDITNWEHRESLIINTAIYALINIDNFKPASDESTQCTMWKIAKQMQTDLDNLYPSTDSLNYNAILSQYDLKYAQLLLFQTDIPQV